MPGSGEAVVIMVLAGFRVENGSGGDSWELG